MCFDGGDRIPGCDGVGLVDDGAQVYPVHGEVDRAVREDLAAESSESRFTGPTGPGCLALKAELRAGVAPILGSERETLRNQRRECPHRTVNGSGSDDLSLHARIGLSDVSR